MYIFFFFFFLFIYLTYFSCLSLLGFKTYMYMQNIFFFTLHLNLYCIYYISNCNPFSFLPIRFFFSVSLNQISHSFSSYFGNMPWSALSMLQSYVQYICILSLKNLFSLIIGQPHLLNPSYQIVIIFVFLNMCFLTRPVILMKFLLTIITAMTGPTKLKIKKLSALSQQYLSVP